MKRQFLIQILMVVVIITAAVFVVAAVRPAQTVAETEACTEDKQEGCIETRTSEFLLESLTRNLLR